MRIMHDRSLRSMILVGVISSTLLGALAWLLTTVASIQTSDSAEVARSRQRLVGSSVTLPEADFLGATIPKGERLVAILTPCNGCSVSGSGKLKPMLEAPRKNYDLPAIYLAPVVDAQVVGAVRKRKSAFIVEDAEQARVMSIAYFIAPLWLRIDGSGRIVEVVQ